MLPQQEIQLLTREGSIVYKDLEPCEILSYLRSCGVFTEDDAEEISHQITRRDRVVSFCRCYVKKASSLEFLREALYQTANDHIWEALTSSTSDEPTVSIADTKSMLIRAKVPGRPNGYVERKALLEMIKDQMKNLFKELSGWLVVHGMAGCGKSVLVAEALRDPLIGGGLFTDLFWINVGPNVNEQRTFALMLDLYSKMGRECAGLSAVEVVKNKLTDLFVLDYQRALVILDDVWSEVEVRCFDELNCRVVATTRNVDVFDVVSDDKKVVQMLPYGFTLIETVKAFAYWLGDPTLAELPPEAMQIYQRCKGNPFFISLVGSLIKNNRNRWSYYLNHLNYGRLSDIRHLSQYKYSTFTDTMLPSLENLQADLKASYFELGVFPLGAQLNSHVLSKFWGIELEKAEDMMSRFADRSLVTMYPLPDRTFGYKLYKIHELCHLVTKIMKEEQRNALHKRLIMNYFGSVQKWQGDLRDDGYIYRYLGYHLSRAHLMDAFSEVFTDLKFLERKSRTYGPSYVLNDFKCYKYFVEQEPLHIAALESFVKRNAYYLAYGAAGIEIEQLALNEPAESIIHQLGMKMVRKILACDLSLYLLPCAINHAYYDATPVASFPCKITGGFWLEKEKMFFYIGSGTKWGYYSTDTGKHALCSFLPSSCRGILAIPETCSAVVIFSSYVSVMDLTPYVNDRVQQTSADTQNCLTPMSVNPANLETIFHEKDLIEADYAIPPLPRSVELVDVKQDISLVVLSHDHRWLAIVTCKGVLIVRELLTKKDDDCYCFGDDCCSVQQCCFSLDDQSMAFVHDMENRLTCQMVILSVGSFEQQASFSIFYPQVLYCCWLQASAMSPSEKRLLFVSHRSATICNAQTGAVLLELSSECDIACATTNDQGSRLAIFSPEDGALSVWNLDDGSLIRRLLHPNAMLYMRFSCLNNELLTATRNALRIYDVYPTEEKQFHFIRDFDIVQTKGTFHLLASDFDNRLLALQIPKAEQFATVASLPCRSSCIRWCPSAAFALIGFVTGMIQVYLFANETYAASTPLEAHNHQVIDIIFLPDCRYWLSFSKDALLKSAIKWVKANCSRKAQASNSMTTYFTFFRCLHQSTTPSLFFKLVATKQDEFWRHDDQYRMCETFSVPSARITKCVAFQDNSSRVVTCMWDGGIRVWEVLKRRTLVTVPQAHAQKIIDCDVSNNCLWIASASQDATCKLWSSDADVCLGKIIHLPYAVTCCRFSPTDDYLMTGDAAGEVRMFSLPHGTFCHKLSGHSSAVSEIRFLNTSPEVCMSCASEIKFWSLNKEKPLRSYPLSCPSSRKVALLTSNLIVIADNGGRLYVLSALTRVSHDT